MDLLPTQMNVHSKILLALWDSKDGFKVTSHFGLWKNASSCDPQSQISWQHCCFCYKSEKTTGRAHIIQTNKPANKQKTNKTKRQINRVCQPQGLYQNADGVLHDYFNHHVQARRNSHSHSYSRKRLLDNGEVHSNKSKHNQLMIL